MFGVMPHAVADDEPLCGLDDDRLACFCKSIDTSLSFVGRIHRCMQCNSGEMSAAGVGRMVVEVDFKC